MTTLNESNHDGWTPWTADICPTQEQEIVISLEQAFKNTPKTTVDEAEMIVAKKADDYDRQNLMGLGRLGINGFSAW